MKSDLNEKLVKDIKRKGDIYFEATVSAIDFPLVVDNDWNPLIFQYTHKTKDEFLKVPNEKKLNVIVTSLMINEPKKYLYLLEEAQRIFDEVL